MLYNNSFKWANPKQNQNQNIAAPPSILSSKNCPLRYPPTNTGHALSRNSPRWKYSWVLAQEVWRTNRKRWQLHRIRRVYDIFDAELYLPIAAIFWSVPIQALQRCREVRLPDSGRGGPEVVRGDSQAHQNRAAVKDIPRHSIRKGGGPLKKASPRIDEILATLRSSLHIRQSMKEVDEERKELLKRIDKIT